MQQHSQSDVPTEFRRRGRPTLYKGVKMRSRLEATAAALFDRHGVEWQYEPVCFASEVGQYLPDFVVVGLVDGCDTDRCHNEMPLTYVEVKPWALADKLVRAKMEIIWASDPSATLVVIDPVEMEMWAAPYPDGFPPPNGRYWSPGDVRPHCYEYFLSVEEDPDQDGIPGPSCGRLHLNHDPTHKHPYPGPMPTQL